MASDALPPILLERAATIARIAASLVAPGGFPPFGVVLADGTAAKITAFHIDMRAPGAMEGAFARVEKSAELGQWYAFGYDATVDGGDAVVFFLGARGEPQCFKFVLPYRIDGATVTTSPPRLDRAIPRTPAR